MNCTDPPLTTVRQPIEPMGRMVIELLVGQIAGSAVPHDELLFEPELVVRGSTGPAPQPPDEPGRSARADRASCRQSRRSSVKFLHCSRHDRATLLSSRHRRRLRRSPTDRLNSGQAVTEPGAHRRPWQPGVDPRWRRFRVRPIAPRRARRRRPTPWWRERGHLRGLRPAASPTATATGSATSPASGRACPTCATSASTPSGSRRGTSRRSPTAATTSPTTGPSIRRSGRSPRPRRSSPRPRRSGIRTIVDIVPNHVSDQHPWFQAALAAGPGSPERERFWFRPGRGPNGDEMPTDWRVQLLGPDLDPDDATRTARRASGTSTCSPPEQPDLNWDHPDVRARARGHPPLLVRPRRRRRPDRLGGAAGQGPGAARGPGRPAARRAPEHRPRRAPRHLPRLARRRRRATRTTGSSSARSGCRTSSASRSTSGRTSCTPPSTSTSWPGRGTPPSLRASIDATLAAHAPVGAPATWVLSNHDVTRPVTRYGREDTLVRVRGQAARDVPTDLALGPAPGPGRRAPRAPPCPARSTSTRATSSASTRSQDLPARPAPGPDVLPLRRRRPRSRRLPRAAALVRRRAAVRLQPGRRDAPSRGCASPRHWARADRRGAAGRPGLDAQPLPRRAARSAAPSPASATGRSRWLPSPDGRPRLRPRRRLRLRHQPVGDRRSRCRRSASRPARQRRRLGRRACRPTPRPGSRTGPRPTGGRSSGEPTRRSG